MCCHWNQYLQIIILICMFSVKEKLKEDADCEIATTMLRVSLMCPLGKMRMTTPCRLVNLNPDTKYKSSNFLSK